MLSEVEPSQREGSAESKHPCRVQFAELNGDFRYARNDRACNLKWPDNV